MNPVSPNGYDMLAIGMNAPGTRPLLACGRDKDRDGKMHRIRAMPSADSAGEVHAIECRDDAAVLTECLRPLAGGQSAEAWEGDRLGDARPPIVSAKRPASAPAYGDGCIGLVESRRLRCATP